MIKAGPTNHRTEVAIGLDEARTILMRTLRHADQGMAQGTRVSQRQCGNAHRRLLGIVTAVDDCLQALQDPETPFEKLAWLDDSPSDYAERVS